MFDQTMHVISVIGYIALSCIGVALKVKAHEKHDEKDSCKSIFRPHSLYLIYFHQSLICIKKT